MTGHTLSAGCTLGRRHMRRAELVARWKLKRRSGEAVEVLAAVVPTRARDRRLVVAERTPAGRWTATHVLAPTPEAVRVLRRQAELHAGEIRLPGTEAVA